MRQSKTARKRKTNGRDKTYTVKHDQVPSPSQPSPKTLGKAVTMQQLIDAVDPKHEVIGRNRKPAAQSAEDQKRTLHFTRAEDTKRYAKFIVSERDGVFGHIYVPLEKAEGLVGFDSVGVRG